MLQAQHQGGLGFTAARYLLHQYFVRRHSWMLGVTSGMVIEAIHSGWCTQKSSGTHPPFFLKCFTCVLTVFEQILEELF